MNWDIAKNWLIIAFFVLDLLLGWLWMQSRREMSSYVESSTDLLANTRTLLAQHGFSLNADVPDARTPLPLVAADYASVSLRELVSTAFANAKNESIESFTHTAVTSTGKVQITSDGQWKVEYVYPVLAGDVKGPAAPSQVWHGGEYSRDIATDSPNHVTYVERFQSFPVFDAVTQLETRHGRVLGYIQTAISNIHAVGDRQPVISALDALNSLANSVDKSNEPYDNKIVNIQLGYKQKISVNSDAGPKETQNYWFPVWRIITNSGQYFINAFTGEVTTAY